MSPISVAHKNTKVILKNEGQEGKICLFSGMSTSGRRVGARKGGMR
jgi:hypothetical protein